MTEYEYTACADCKYYDKEDHEEPCVSCKHGTIKDGMPERFVPVGKPDPVNHPAHYEGQTSLECIDAIELAFGQEGTVFFCLCNAFKYLWRHRHKGGREDLDKAGWYLDRAGRYPAYMAQEDQADTLKRMLKEAREAYDEGAGEADE